MVVKGLVSQTDVAVISTDLETIRIIYSSSCETTKRKLCNLLGAAGM